MITKEKIIALAQQQLNGGSLFLVDVKVSPSNKIEVFIDGDNGVAISDCVAMSRFIEKSLDRDAEDFSLEVSSPGATAPLRLPRQYQRHIGRELDIELSNGEKISGTLTGLDGSEAIVIETTTRQPKPVGKGKMTVVEKQTIGLNTIKESKIKLKF